MTDKVQHLERTWRRSRRFCLYWFPAWVILITAINICSDHADGKPLNPTNILALIGFLAFDAVLLGFMWLIYRFVLGIVSSGIGHR